MVYLRVCFFQTCEYVTSQPGSGEIENRRGWMEPGYGSLLWEILLEEMMVSVYIKVPWRND